MCVIVYSNSFVLYAVNVRWYLADSDGDQNSSSLVSGQVESERRGGYVCVTCLCGIPCTLVFVCVCVNTAAKMPQQLPCIETGGAVYARQQRPNNNSALRTKNGDALLHKLRIVCVIYTQTQAIYTLMVCIFVSHKYICARRPHTTTDNRIHVHQNISTYLYVIQKKIIHTYKLMMPKAYTTTDRLFTCVVLCIFVLYALRMRCSIYSLFVVGTVQSPRVGTALQCRSNAPRMMLLLSRR